MLYFLLMLTFFAFRDEPMIPEEHEEVNMNDFDPEADRRQRTMSEVDEDQMHGHGPGVSCATQ